MKHLKYLLFILPLLFLSIENVDAVSYTYRLENIAYAPTQGCSTNGKYSYTLNSSPATYRTGTFGYGDYNINGRMSALSVVFDYSLKANNSYSITFRNPNSSFVKPTLSKVVIAYSSSFNTSDCGDVVTRKNATSVIVSGSDLIIYFTTPSTSYDAFGIEVNDDLGSYYLSGSGSNFRLNPYVLLTDVTAEGTADSYQQIIDSQNKNTENIIENDNKNHEEFMGTITDDTPPDTENFIESMQGLTNDNAISNLVLMPLTLLRRYSEVIDGSCVEYNLGNLLGTDLILPCLDMENILGDHLWNIIDSLFSIFMIYNIGMLFVSAFNDLTSLRDTFDSMYVPQHTYKPKHSGGDE